MDSLFAELIKLGAAGLVIWVVTAPLVKYLIDRSKRQDERMEKLLDDHFTKDGERHGVTMATLQRVEHNLGQMEKVLTALPQTMIDRVQKIYPPQPQSTVVNVAQPGPVNASRPASVTNP